MSQTVIGIFDNENEAQQAVQNLCNRGFNREDVDIASRGTTSNTNSSSNDDDDDSFGHSISNFFGSLFGNDDDNTSKYAEVAKRGVTVTVHARSEDEAELAADLLDEYGAVNVDERASQYRSNSGSNLSDTDRDYNKTNLSGSNLSDRTTDTDNTDDTTARSIPIIEENLEVGKREVESGGARIRSRIVEKPVEENVRLRTERVNVERNPVNRQATDADFNTFKEGTIEMTEHKEVPVVEKEAWVKEEISLNKDVEEREETIRDTVRSTEVDVENLSESDRLENSRLSSNDDYDDDLDDDTNLNRNGDRLV
ncbi:MAG: hypothetical protein JWN56_1868 [Sphingobacteriales bacterium]|nr:hypothetical protein [Sphingobacteriales bacterium]